MRENHSVAAEPEPVSVQVVEWLVFLRVDFSDKCACVLEQSTNLLGLAIGYVIATQGDGGHVKAQIFSCPPVTGFPALSRGGEMVVEQGGPNPLGRPVGKGIRFKQPEHTGITFQQPHRKIHKPRVLLHSSKRREPHLPVKPGLVRCHKRGRPFHVARLVLEIISQPVFAIITSFDDDFRPRPSHDTEQAVIIDAAE